MPTAIAAIIAALAAASLFMLVMGLSGMLTRRSRSARETVLRRLGSKAEPDGDRVDIVRRESMSGVGWLNRLLFALSWSSRLDRTLRRAGLDVSVGVFVLTACLMGAGGFVLGRLSTPGPVLPLAAGVILGAAPFVWLSRRKNKRMDHFSRQLPDALDLIARALKAGHSFTQGLRLAADEMADPMGPELAATLEEINFGVPTDLALASLSRRVDCPDLDFFTVSVNIQRETGGNLAEIVTTIANLIRERFTLMGRVRVLSAEGKLTAYILLALPLVIALVIRLLNPDYMSRLTDTTAGQAMLGAAATSMILGAVVIRKLIAIKV